MLKLQSVWIPYPNINKADFRSVDWADKAAVMDDPRFGYYVSVPVFGAADADVKTWLADGDVSESEVSGIGAPVMALGALALLFLL